MTSFIDQRVVERIRADYLEMPGMRLTIEQVRRLCGIESVMCKVALDSLVKAGFLRCATDGTYIRQTEGPAPVPRPAKAALTPIPLATPTRRAS